MIKIHRLIIIATDDRNMMDRVKHCIPSLRRLFPLILYYIKLCLTLQSKSVDFGISFLMLVPAAFIPSFFYTSFRLYSTAGHQFTEAIKFLPSTP